MERSCLLRPLRQLRSVRRALRSPPDLVAGATAEAFRKRIKAVELEAERLQQEAMFALAPPGVETAVAEETAHANIAAYEEMRRVRFPPTAIATVLSSLAIMMTQA